MTQTRTFAVQGMSCEHCQAAVTKALKGVPGVDEARVDLSKAQAVVGYDPDQVTVDRLTQAVADAGYTLAAV